MGGKVSFHFRSSWMAPHTPRDAVYPKEMKATPNLNIYNVLQSFFSVENELHFIFTCIMMSNTN